MNERRIARIQELIKERVAEVVQQELSDPKAGMITITRVAVDRELALCRIYWSVLGDERVRRTNERILERARGFVRRQIAAVLTTRTVPQVAFVHDESIEGAIRMNALLRELREERERREDDAEPPDRAPE